MSNSWKATLRLPKTSFPPKPIPGIANFLKRSTDDHYHWQKTRLPRKSTFFLHDGPPYANGSLHVGHALNKILKDMILRSMVQEGRRVVYNPGWDCHGLPIEIKALEQLNNAKNLSPVEIRSAARALAEKTVEEQMKSFRAYGIMADWEKRWRTMDHAFEIAQLRLFQELVRHGLIYRKNKPVYWSPSSRSALAEAELEYKDDHVSHTAYVKFPIVRDAGFWQALGLEGFDGKLSAVIWTTTPWTLPANKAIAVNDDMEYVILQDQGDALIVSKDRLQSDPILSRDAHEVLVETIRGSQLKGLTYINKLQGRNAQPQPIVHANFVSNESGTGLVHLAPGHGQEDYEVCSVIGIPAFAPIDDDGHFTSEAYPDNPEKLTSAGSILKGAGKAVLNLLGDDVLRIQKLKHKYPYDWRTKQPVVMRATSQWFADVGSIKDEALAALGDVRFVPESGRNRLESFIRDRSEWCISRQRAWGVPIPALYDEHQEAVMDHDTIEHIIKVIESRKGTETWFSDDPEHPAWVPPFLKGKGKFYRGTDTMDVWFDSGSSWTQTPGRADVYLEGSDQHRGWFQSSLLTHIAAFRNQKDGMSETLKSFAPFKTLVTHGFTLDKDGKKMSKSLGNVISPDLVMNGTQDPKSKSAIWNSTAWGPDVLRLWVASSDFTKDVIISVPVMQSVKNSLAKYRITLRMLLGLLHDATPHAPVTALDQMALLQLEDTMSDVRKAYGNFEFQKGVSNINRWLSADLSAFYLEAAKDRLYCGGGVSITPALFHGFLRMLAPITPQLVVEAWHHCPSWLSQHQGFSHPLQTPWTEPLWDKEAFTMAKERLRRDIPRILALKAAVQRGIERGREQKLIGSSLQSRVILNQVGGDFAEPYRAELADMLVVSEVSYRQPVPPNPAFHFMEEVDVGGEKIGVHVLPPEKDKCPRCWRYVVPKQELGAPMLPQKGETEQKAPEPENHVHGKGEKEDLCGRCTAEVKYLRVGSEGR